MKKSLTGLVLTLLSTTIWAETASFDLTIKGAGIDVSRSLELSDVGEGKTKINFNFKDSDGNLYNFDLKYKALPDNRSFPTNIDVTLKDSKGNKEGYLFFANNGVSFLRAMGEFGLLVDVKGNPVDIKFTFDKDIKGNISISDLESERFVQDTLVSSLNFQMIRPVIIPKVKEGVRSQTYSLDSHPYSINYTIKDISNNRIQFQHNLYETSNGNNHLLERVYFNAGSIETLREAMYAAKYFHEKTGTFKLVFYPAMGQTEPSKN